MRYILLMFILLFSPVFSKDYFIHKLSVAAIFQNEADYLEEWIEHHIKYGVERFYLYNNNSTDDYQKVLKPYIKSGVVKLIPWPSKKKTNDWENFSFTTQTGAYNHAIEICKHRSKWLALIDIDEYIIPVIDSTITECLEKRFNQVSGLNVNWQCYGTSNVEKAPYGQMTQTIVTGKQ